MAYSKVPTDWLASYTSDDTTLTVPRATFPELTAAEANTTTGYIVDISHAIVDKLAQEYIDKTAAGNAPTKMTITRGTSTNDTTGVVTKTYQFQFLGVVAAGGFNPSAES